MLGLGRLPAFIAVYRHRSVALAAKQLHLTPSAVSIAVKNLEREVGGELFSRVGKRFVPTPFGEALHGVAARLLDELGSVVTAHELERGKISGNLRVGAVGGFGARALVAMTGDFVRRHPGVTAVVRTGSVRLLVDLLLEGEIGLAVVAKGAMSLKAHASVAANELRHHGYDLRLVCSPDFLRERVGGKVTLARLAALDHIALLEAPRRLKEWYRHNFDATPRLRIALTCDNVFAAIAAAKNHFGVCLLPSDVISDELASAQLVELGKPLVSASFRYLLLQMKDRVPPPVERAFLRALLADTAREQRPTTTASGS